jgi:GNAT superfamily N-acetyltransferase
MSLLIYGTLRQGSNLFEPRMGDPPIIDIRRAEVGDARAIAEVHIESYRSTYRGILPDALLDGLSVESRASAWRERLAAVAPGSLTLVACDADERVVGFLSGGAERTGKLAKDSEIYAIYLLHQAQRRGLGTQLVQRFVGEMTDRGLASMAVWVLARNPSRRFYEAMGGQIIAEQTIERGGESFTQLAYGWHDLTRFSS